VSLKKVEQVRSDKGFKIYDLIIYAAVILVIVALFLSFVVFRDTTKIDGISVYLKNELAFTYTFDGDEYNVVKSENIEIISNDSTELNIKILSDDDGYNLLTINKIEGWADVTEANCSTRKDCVYMDRIEEKSQGIFCTPHGLKILPYDYEEVDDGKINM
jgi:hypothetical protein